jgi:hypothetical protein
MTFGPRETPASYFLLLARFRVPHAEEHLLCVHRLVEPIATRH